MNVDRIDPIPDEFVQFVREALRQSDPVWPAKADSASSERFLRATADHGIQPLLYRYVPRMPDHIGRVISAALAAGAALEAVRRRDLDIVLDALVAAGVDPILIKGAALSLTHYETPELRPRADTDLFIRKNDFTVVADVMRSCGYRTTHQPGRDLVFSQGTFFRREQFGISHSYDFHWRLTNLQMFRDVLSWEECAAEAVKTPGIAAKTLSPKHALLLACVHRVAHHANSIRLIWLADIHRLAAGMSLHELSDFWKLAERKRLLAICIASVQAAEKWFGAVPHVHLPEDPGNEPARRLLSPISRVELLWLDARSLPGWTARLRLVRQLAFPAPVTMIPAGRSRALLPYAYIRRILRGLSGWLRRM